MPSTSPASNTAVLRLAVPVLPSLQIDGTLEFYEQRLGFKTRARYGDYGILARDGVELHFWLCTDPEVPKITTCRVQVDHLERLYREYRGAGVIHPDAPLRVRPWGRREFGAVDGDGNLIVFFE